MREAEGVTDEGIVACARLKQAMIVARQQPEFGVGTGQGAVLRLNRAEQHFASAYNELLRVHAELSDIATRTTAITDDGVPTDIRGTGQLTTVPEPA